MKSCRSLLYRPNSPHLTSIIFNRPELTKIKNIDGSLEMQKYEKKFADHLKVFSRNYLYQIECIVSFFYISTRHEAHLENILLPTRFRKSSSRSLTTISPPKYFLYTNWFIMESIPSWEIWKSILLEPKCRRNCPNSCHVFKRRLNCAFNSISSIDRTR